MVVGQEQSGSGASVSTENVASVSKRKSTDWSPTVFNTRGSSDVIRMGDCVGDSQAPSLLIVLRAQPLGLMLLRAVSSLVWSCADQTWSWRRLKCLTATLLCVRPFQCDSKPIPLHLGPSGHFSSGCFRADPTAITRVSLSLVFFCLFSSSSYSLP